MPARRFLDTNILIYAFAADDPRSTVAENILSEGGVISVQVLNEFVNVSRRKLKLDWDAIEERLEVVRDLLDAPEPITHEIHNAARKIARDRQLSFYDALIVAAARAAECDFLLTEDLQHGAKFGGTEIRNPFRA